MSDSNYRDYLSNKLSEAYSVLSKAESVCSALPNDNNVRDILHYINNDIRSLSVRISRIDYEKRTKEVN